VGNIKKSPTFVPFQIPSLLEEGDSDSAIVLDSSYSEENTSRSTPGSHGGGGGDGEGGGWRLGRSISDVLRIPVQVEKFTFDFLNTFFFIQKKYNFIIGPLMDEASMKVLHFSFPWV
jgi:hypothetical protein